MSPNAFPLLLHRRGYRIGYYLYCTHLELKHEEHRHNHPMKAFSFQPAQINFGSYKRNIDCGIIEKGPEQDNYLMSLFTNVPYHRIYPPYSCKLFLPKIGNNLDVRGFPHIAFITNVFTHFNIFPFRMNKMINNS